MKSLLYAVILLTVVNASGQTQSQPSTTPAAAPAASTATATTDADAESVETPEEVAPPAPALGLKPGPMINLGITTMSRKLEETGVSNDFNTIVGELRGGFNFDYGLFVGATAHYDSGKLSGNSIQTYYAGPTVGYNCKWSGFFVAATYHLIGKSDLDTLGEYDKTTGLQVDIAYPMTLSERFKFGPQLSYRSMEASDSDTLADNKTKELVPFMGLWFIF